MEELKQSITRLDQELEQSATAVKQARTELKEYVEDLESYKEVQRLKTELKAAKLQLKVELQGDANYNRMSEELAERKFKHKDLKEILSNHLIQFRLQNVDEDAVVVADKTQKPIILNGKLGKAEPENMRMEFKNE